MRPRRNGVTSPAIFCSPLASDLSKTTASAFYAAVFTRQILTLWLSRRQTLPAQPSAALPSEPARAGLARGGRLRVLVLLVVAWPLDLNRVAIRVVAAGPAMVTGPSSA